MIANKSSGVTLPEVHGTKKMLDMNILPEKKTKSNSTK